MNTGVTRNETQTILKSFLSHRLKNVSLKLKWLCAVLFEANLVVHKELR